MRWRRPRRDKEDIAKELFPVGTVCPTTETVTISPYEDPWTLFEVIIHEGIHACFLDIEEQPVLDAGRDIVKLFRKVGLKISFDGKQDQTLA